MTQQTLVQSLQFLCPPLQELLLNFVDLFHVLIPYLTHPVRLHAISPFLHLFLLLLRTVKVVCQAPQLSLSSGGAGGVGGHQVTQIRGGVKRGANPNMDVVILFFLLSLRICHDKN